MAKKSDIANLRRMEEYIHLALSIGQDPLEHSREEWDDVNVMLYAAKGDPNAMRITTTWNPVYMRMVTLMFDFCLENRRADGEDEWEDTRSEAAISKWKARIEAKYGQAAQ